MLNYVIFGLWPVVMVASLFFLVGSKAHARPTILLVIALFAIVAGYGLDILATKIAALPFGSVEINEINRAMFHGARLGSIVSATIAGAMIGAGVSNRAKYAHEMKVQRLLGEWNFIARLENPCLEALKSAAGMASSADPGEKTLARHNQRTAFEGLHDLLIRREELEEELKSLGVKTLPPVTGRA